RGEAECAFSLEVQPIAIGGEERALFSDGSAAVRPERGEVEHNLETAPGQSKVRECAGDVVMQAQRAGWSFCGAGVEEEAADDLALERRDGLRASQRGRADQGHDSRGD